MKTITNFQTGTFSRTAILLLCLILCTPSLFASTTPSEDNSGDLRKKIRLEFNSSNSYTRELNVIADENATDGYDEDFDVALNAVQADDMYWLIDEGKFLDQSIQQMNEDTNIPLGMTVSTFGMNSIAIDKLDNIPTEMKIFVHDIQLGVFHNIKEGPYEVVLNAGTYLNRFEIVFNQPDTLGLNEVSLDDKALDIFFDVSTKEIKIANHNNMNIKTVEVYSLLGQAVHRSNTTSTTNELKINSNHMSTGAYVVIVASDQGINSKKILVN